MYNKHTFPETHTKANIHILVHNDRHVYTVYMFTLACAATWNMAATIINCEYMAL